MVAEQFPQRNDQQVPQCVLVQLSLAGEPVLQDLGPGTSPLVVPAECGQRLPEIPRGQHTELLTQPARGTTVVGNGDDRRHVAADATQRGQRGGQPVTSPERDDLDARETHGHSRPRSRCMTMVGIPDSRSRSPNASDIATLRCLPPVQPTATVMYRLPSRR